MKIMVSQFELDTCRRLNEALREREAGFHKRIAELETLDPQLLAIAKNCLDKSLECIEATGKYNHDIMCIIGDLIWVAKQVLKMGDKNE